MSAYDDEYTSQDGGTVTEERSDLLEQVLANTAAQSQSMSAEALQATIKAEIDIQISTAKAYPRDLKKFLNTVRTLATVDEKTAGDCFYKLPRGGKKIEGPSIRMAEIVSYAWGNLRMTGRLTSVDQRTLTVQGICHDLETNNQNTAETRRNITGRNGRFNDDMITMTANAAMSIAIRNAIFRTVPRAHWQPILDEVKLVSLGKNKTFTQQRDDALKYWHGRKITDEQICQTLEIASINDLTIDDLISLRGFFTAIKDGEAKIEDIFPPPGAKTNGQSLADRLKERAASVKPSGNGDATTTTTTDKPADTKPTDEASTVYNDLLKAVTESGDELVLEEVLKNSANDMFKLRKLSAELLTKLEEKIKEHRKTITAK